MARAKNGEPCRIIGDEACSFCLLGAMCRTDCGVTAAKLNVEVLPYLELPDTFRRNYCGVMSFNDAATTKFADVKQVLAVSIEKLESANEVS